MAYHQDIRDIARNFALGWGLLYTVSSLFIIQQKIVWIASFTKNFSVLPLAICLLIFLASALLTWLEERGTLTSAANLFIWGITILLGGAIIFLRLFL